MSVDADHDLFQSMLEHLLGNAWKFTSRRKLTLIELGAIEQDGKRVYFVRDNGVGFDPAHAGKLFLPFKRLHREQDFPGTGIGLALVDRILRKHGGRIWAESKIDEGATFYFTLWEADK